MKKILVTGASGQIGSELVPALRERYGDENVVAGMHRQPLTPDVRDGGPWTPADVTDRGQIDDAMARFNIDSVFHLASVLSATAEQYRQTAYAVNFNGLFNVFESAVAHGASKVVSPSSIAAFGPETPPVTPNDTIQKPNTGYGISKVFGELMGNYYHSAVGLDVRGVRLPGIVSWKVEPTSGTTDYAVAIFYGALKEGRYTCYLRPDSTLPMMYMPDAVRSLIGVAEADGSKLSHRADFNVAAISFTPEQLEKAIKRRMPDFEMSYEVDPLRQAIADSWPDELINDVARQEWGWRPEYGLDEMVDDMFENLGRKLGAEMPIMGRITTETGRL